MQQLHRYQSFDLKNAYAVDQFFLPTLQHHPAEILTQYKVNWHFKIGLEGSYNTHWTRQIPFDPTISNKIWACKA